MQETVSYTADQPFFPDRLKEKLRQIPDRALSVLEAPAGYGKTTAVNDLSFHLNPGEVTVLLGPNGAGKSTLMKSVIGFLKYQGEITVAGYPNKSVEARRVLGYIPEMPTL